ncbi:MAG: Unknown protein [uncultured Sulfurovum sp.]|uniref:Uncharacterized protein n=1 Tax=uncultured Sulfurovum sp. TaxID=269237 RepID=A0A6S6SWC5_9BACT|nr:MAG: Unknown protein [uncultured Sulfurovum sp.]
MKKASLAMKLQSYITEKREFTLKELYQEFGEYKEHSVRARLYETDEYQEKRIIKTENGSYALCGVELEALIEKVDTREHLYTLTNAKVTYDLLLNDLPYSTNANRGGNRDLTDYPLITPEDFSSMITQIENSFYTKQNY